MSFASLVRYCQFKRAFSVHVPRPLRPYQKECLDKCISSLGEGVKRQVVSLPVGSGKTEIFSQLIGRVPIPKNVPTAKKTLVLAHREELIDQAWNAIKRNQPQLVVDIDRLKRADIKASPEDSDVIVASIPSLGRSDSSRISKYKPSDFKCIVIDEAHHSSAPTYLRVLDYFKARDANSHIFLWGCTATLRREDGVGLEHIFQKITYHKGFIDMMREKWLSTMKVLSVQTKQVLDSVSVNEGDFTVKQLEKTVNTSDRNDLIFETWKKEAANRKSTLIFAVNVQHVIDLTDTFKQRGVDARFVTGDTPKDERSILLKEFREHKFPVMINCGVFTEGTDIPTIDCVIVARPTLSSVLMHQMIGRGLRKIEGKEDCLVIDVVDNLTKNTLVTVPSLFGLNPSFVSKGKDILEIYEEMQNLLADNPQAARAKSLEEAQHIVNVMENQEIKIEEKIPISADIDSVVTLDWAQVNPGRYVLPLGHTMMNAEIEIFAVKPDELKRMKSKLSQIQGIKLTDTAKSPTLGKNITYLAQLGPRNSIRDKIITLFEKDTLESALTEAEEYIRKKYPQAATNVRRDADWKKQPATSAQLAQLFKYDEALYSEGEGMTRGELSLLLDKLAREKRGKKLYKTEIIPLEQSLKKLTSFDWMSIETKNVRASNTYVLGIRIPDNFNYLEVVQNILGKYEAKIYKKGQGKGNMIQELLTEQGGEPAKEAFRKAEEHVTQHFQFQARFLKKNATWKNEPATSKQLNYLKSLGVEIDDNEHITQGRASLLIDQAIRDQQSQRFNKIS